MSKSEPKKRKTYTLKLSKFELLHLRDLCSVALPPDLKVTVSQALALAEDRSIVEAKLWNKIAQTCKEANLPLDEDAPDFIVAASSAPTISVYRIADEPGEHPEEGDEGAIFEGVTPTGEADEEDNAACGGTCHDCGRTHKSDNAKRKCYAKTHP